jgi:hypothetical protein
VPRQLAFRQTGTAHDAADATSTELAVERHLHTELTIEREQQIGTWRTDDETAATPWLLFGGLPGPQINYGRVMTTCASAWCGCRWLRPASGPHSVTPASRFVRLRV